MIHKGFLGARAQARLQRDAVILAKMRQLGYARFHLVFRKHLYAQFE